jgi:hypothetical protein
MSKSRLRAIILIVAIAMPSAFIFREFIRDQLVIPIAYVFWIIQLYAESVPQMFVWIFLILLAVILLAKGVLKVPKLAGSRGRGSYRRMGQVETWLEWINRAKGGRYFKSRLSRRLAELTIASIAFDKRISERDVERGLEHGLLNLPENVQAYLQRGLSRESWRSYYNPVDSLRSLLGQESTLFDRVELVDIVSNLEKSLKRGEVHER